MASGSVPVVLVDYGMGNLHSVGKALARVGAEVVRTCDPEVVRKAERLVVPGVGGFPDAMATLQRTGLDEALLAATARGVPLLGICLGMQVLFSRSHEFGAHAGLGVIAGEVVPFPEDFPRRGLKIPHMGWNAIALRRAHPVLQGLDGRYFYFVHSFYCAPTQEEDVVAETEYGDLRFCSIVARENLLGVQFHPEKSQRAGLRLLENFLRWSP